MAAQRNRLILAQLLGMPVLVTALLGAMAVLGPHADAFEKASHATPQPTYAGTEPVTTLAEKPTPPALRWVLPVHGYHLTARFGMSSGLWAHGHTGLDFAAPTGTPIHAVTSGVVTEAGWAGAYGNRTIVTFRDGTELWYCHQTTIGVHVGQHVMPGQVIGTIGSTGNVTGPHLHLEVRPDPQTPIDPYAVLRHHGLRP